MLGIYRAAYCETGLREGVLIDRLGRSRVTRVFDCRSGSTSDTYPGNLPTLTLFFARFLAGSTTKNRPAIHRALIEHDQTLELATRVAWKRCIRRLRLVDFLFAALRRRFFHREPWNAAPRLIIHRRQSVARRFERFFGYLPFKGTRCCKGG